MILSDIKHYLQQRHQASLAEIALHCDAEPDAVRGMLEQWMRKGKVERRLMNDLCNTGCGKCDPASVELYIWQDVVAQSDELVGSAKPDCPAG